MQGLAIDTRKIAQAPSFHSDLVRKSKKGMCDNCKTLMQVAKIAYEDRYNAMRAEGTYTNLSLLLSHSVRLCYPAEDKIKEKRDQDAKDKEKRAKEHKEVEARRTNEKIRAAQERRAKELEEKEKQRQEKARADEKDREAKRRRDDEKHRKSNRQ
jgi:hypothetical protein